MSSPLISIAGQRLRFATYAAAVALAIAVTPLAQAETAAPVSPAQTALPSFAPLVKKVMPAVVNISATLKAGTPLSDDADNDQDQDQATPDNPMQGFPQSPFDEMLRKFFEQQGRPVPRERSSRGVALGSGFIIDPSGYVVTNN